MAERTRVLFVDDDELLLEGLQLALRRERRRWSLRCGLGGEAALRLLNEEPADVIVTDMHMPGMNGAEFLEEARRVCPAALRLMLSGPSDEAEVLRALPNVHRWLSKPVEREELIRSVERAASLSRLVRDEPLREVLGGAPSLLAAPKTYTRLLARMREPGTTAKTLSDLVAEDARLAAQVLSLANAASVGLPRALVDVEDVATHLGPEALTHLVLAAELVGSAPGGAAAARYREALRSRSVDVAYVVGLVLSDRPRVRGGVAAGLLHDLGRLALLDRFGEERCRALESRARAEGRPLPELEREILGTGHPELGAVLALLWGLPQSVAEALAHHHAGEEVAASDDELVLAVHLACALVDELRAERGAARGKGEGRSVELAWDPRPGERLGCADRLEEWRAAARERMA